MAKKPIRREMKAKPRDPLRERKAEVEYDFQPSSGLLGDTLPYGTVGSDYVPQDPNRQTNIGYQGDYGQVTNPTYQPAQDFNDRNYEIVNGVVRPRHRQNAQAFHASTPTGAEVTSNPGQYGVTPEELAAWTAANQPPQQTQTAGGAYPGGNPGMGGGLTTPPPLGTGGTGGSGLQEPPPAGGGGIGGSGPGLQEPAPVGGGGVGGEPQWPYPGQPPGSGGGGTGGQPGGPGLAIPDGVLGMDNTLAAYGMMRGPNGEILPIMLKQGGNPFENGGGWMGDMPGFQTGGTPDASMFPNGTYPGGSAPVAGPKPGQKSGMLGNIPPALLGLLR